MKFDITWTVTAIIAIVSIISPVIVSIFNNIHDTKIRKLEMFSKAQQEALSSFGKHAIDNFHSSYVEADFYSSLTNLYAYFKLDDEIVSKLIDYNYENIIAFQKDVSKLMQILSKQIKYK